MLVVTMLVFCVNKNSTYPSYALYILHRLKDPPFDSKLKVLIGSDYFIS